MYIQLILITLIFPVFIKGGVVFLLWQIKVLKKLMNLFSDELYILSEELSVLLTWFTTNEKKWALSCIGCLLGTESIWVCIFVFNFTLHGLFDQLLQVLFSHYWKRKRCSSYSNELGSSYLSNWFTVGMKVSQQSF